MHFFHPNNVFSVASGVNPRGKLSDVVAAVFDPGKSLLASILDPRIIESVINAVVSKMTII